MLCFTDHIYEKCYKWEFCFQCLNVPDSGHFDETVHLWLDILIYSTPLSFLLPHIVCLRTLKTSLICKFSFHHSPFKHIMSYLRTCTNKCFVNTIWKHTKIQTSLQTGYRHHIVQFIYQWNEH